MIERRLFSKRIKKAIPGKDGFVGLMKIALRGCGWSTSPNGERMG
jgi:hypothetical protein